jgi:hypothetical protein
MKYKIIADYRGHTIREATQGVYTCQILSSNLSDLTRHEGMIYEGEKLILDLKFASLEDAKSRIQKELK